MSIISRLTTWTIGQVLKASDLNGEFSNITNLFNNLDSGSTSWTNVKTGILTPTNVGPFTATGAIAMGGNKITGLGNGTASADATSFGQIKYLQCITAPSSTATSTTSSTFTACTNQSVVIIPTSSSNRVKITVNSVITLPSVSNSGTVLTLKRGTTELSGVANGFWICDQAAGNLVMASFNYIDSPATTSSTTYQLFIKSTDNTHTVQAGRSDLISVITAEEIV